MDHQFRTAAFGGFNRQDVLDYLASSALANQQQLQAVQEQLDQSRKELEESAAQKDEIQALQAQAGVRTWQRSCKASWRKPRSGSRS